MTYPTRQECDESFDNLPSDEGGTCIERMHPTDQIKFKSHISTLRKNDVAFLRERVEEMKQEPFIDPPKGSQAEAMNLGIKGYNRALTDVLYLLTECEGKLK